MRLKTAGVTTKIPAGVGRPPLSPAILAGGLVLAIYVALLPFIERTWQATGDEPHYLLAAHSLVTDFDFDLTNNYAQFDYLAFYLSPDITPHIRIHKSGAQLLNHGLGLPVVIAPAYALGGRFGVLLFQLLLGGLLAGLTCRLTMWATQDKPAALIATGLVMLTPPLLMYHYLIYPELIGALLTTLIVYLTLSRERPGPGAVILVTLSLILLPWLNRRFIALTILLALLGGASWRQTGRLLSRPGLVGGGAALLSVALLLWFNSQFEAPARTDFTTPTLPVLGWKLGRGVGWLLDQQRGLFVYAPIYIMALGGGPFLFRDPLPRGRRIWPATLPFLLSLAMTAAAGGFWVAWELGPRFLVVGLPALAPLFALAWQRYGRSIGGSSLMIALLAVSIYHTVLIIQTPHLPYKSSLALHYEETFGLPLTKILPDLAESITISASEAGPAAGRLAIRAGERGWVVEAGRPADIIQPTPLPDLPFGHYRLIWPVRVDSDLNPETALLRISAKLLGGGSLFNKMITSADLVAADGSRQIRYKFLNTNVDRWRTPPVFQAVSAGHTHIWAGDIHFRPDPFYAWVLPYLYLTLLIAGSLLGWRRGRRFSEKQRSSSENGSQNWRKRGREGETSPAAARLWSPFPNSKRRFFPASDVIEAGRSGRSLLRSRLSRRAAWPALLLVLALAWGWLIYQKSRSRYTYDAANLNHFIGRIVEDPQARDGRAWLVDPQIDPPQKAVYGPFDIYGPGLYRVAFRMNLARPVESEQALAHLRVTATDRFDELITQPIHAGHFSGPNLYHDFVLTVANPRRQALSFEVHYTGLAPLVIDGVMVDRVGEVGDY